MDTSDWLLTGLLLAVAGGVLWTRPVVEIPARLGLWLVLGGLAVGLLGAAGAEVRQRTG